MLRRRVTFHGSVSEVYKLRKLLGGHAMPSWRGALGSAAVCAAIYTAPAFAQSVGSIIAAQASEHIGETRAVCGTVMSPKFLSSSRSQPTFLNLDKPYPNQIFTVVIFSSDRPKFGAPEVKYRDKRICATGLIKLYRGKPEIIATQPSQITQEP
jgi:hypothetical protein